MSQNGNNDSCGCNDGYAQRTANTGLKDIAVANTNLDGVTGTYNIVLTAAAFGTTIKSITIKAYGPVTKGMVRFFVDGTGSFILLKEVPVPTTPALANTPTPAPMLKTFETVLEGGFKLNAGTNLYATIQNNEPFSIIVEGIDWTYPGTLPTVCCNFRQETAITGAAMPAFNTLLDGTLPITPVITAPSSSSNGTVIKTITVKGLQSTNEGIVRLFISNAAKYYLFREIYIPQTTQSGFDPAFKAVLNENFHLKPGYQIGATTQVNQSFGVTIEGVAWYYA